MCKCKAGDFGGRFPGNHSALFGLVSYTDPMWKIHGFGDAAFFRAGGARQKKIGFIKFSWEKNTIFFTYPDYEAMKALITLGII